MKRPSWLAWQLTGMQLPDTIVRVLTCRHKAAVHHPPTRDQSPWQLPLGCAPPPRMCAALPALHNDHQGCLKLFTCWWIRWRMLIQPGLPAVCIMPRLQPPRCCWCGMATTRPPPHCSRHARLCECGPSPRWAAVALCKPLAEVLKLGGVAAGRCGPGWRGAAVAQHARHSSIKYTSLSTGRCFFAARRRTT